MGLNCEPVKDHQARVPIRRQIWDQGVQQIWEQVERGVWARTLNRVWWQVRVQVDQSVEEQARNPIWDQIWDQEEREHGAGL